MFLIEVIIMFLINTNNVPDCSNNVPGGNDNDYVGIAGNVGKQQPYQLCGEDDETTEHVFVCKAIENKRKLTSALLQDENCKEWKAVVELFQTYTVAYTVAYTFAH